MSIIVESTSYFRRLASISMLGGGEEGAGWWVINKSAEKNTSDSNIYNLCGSKKSRKVPANFPKDVPSKNQEKFTDELL